MNPYEDILELRIATMGIRLIVFLIVATVCVMNARSVAAWPALAALSSLMSGPVLTARTAGHVPSQYVFEALRGERAPKNSVRYREKHRADEDWSELILTIQWPQTFCINYNDTHNGSDICVVPPSIKQWTIHGLWPSVPGTLGPAFCNDTWKFDRKQISDLESKLNQSWPDYISSDDYYELWSHEWEKHGTCASSLPALYGEHNYFQKTLQLFQNYDVYSILEKGGVTPTMEMSYSFGKIFEAVTKGVGKNATISCLYDQKSRLVYLAEIEFCMNKQFQPIDCSPSKPESHRAGRLMDEDCSHDQLIFYPPMNGV